MEEQNVFLLAKAESQSIDPGCNFTGSPAFFFCFRHSWNVISNNTKEVGEAHSCE